MTASFGRDYSPTGEGQLEVLTHSHGEKGFRVRDVFYKPKDAALGPLDTGINGERLQYEKRKATITDDKGELIFEQDNVEVPNTWSQLATRVVASKYFYGRKDGIDLERETSVRQLVDRVVKTITREGLNRGYFASAEDAQRFYNNLAWLCLNQYGAFNSPVWFNMGTTEHVRNKIGRA